MSGILPATGSDARSAVAKVLENSPPILVEVRFPGSATSPDWHLFETEEQFDQLLERLGPGVELHISSVWALKNPKGEILLKK
jgi:hypothetical protein